MSFRRRASLDSIGKSDAEGAIRVRDSWWPLRPKLLLVALPIADLADHALTKVLWERDSGDRASAARSQRWIGLSPVRPKQ